MSGIAGHATLIAGRWPAPRPPPPPPRAAAGRIPAAPPASAAKLLHVSVGDVLRLRDRLDNALVSFDITGVFTPRPASGPDDSYWALSYIPARGVSASYASSTYGPLVVSPAAFGPGLTQQSGSWLAQPDMTDIPDGSLGPDSASVAALVASLPNATFLNGAQLTSSLPTVLDRGGQQPHRRAVAAGDQRPADPRARGRGAGRGRAAARRPAGGGDRAAHRPRRDPLAAHQAHRGRGGPVVGAGVGGGRAGGRPAGRRAGRRGGAGHGRASGWRAGRASGPTRSRRRSSSPSSPSPRCSRPGLPPSRGRTAAGRGWWPG